MEKRVTLCQAVYVMQLTLRRFCWFYGCADMLRFAAKEFVWLASICPMPAICLRHESLLPVAHALPAGQWLLSLIRQYPRV